MSGLNSNPQAAKDYTPAAPKLWQYDILCALLTQGWRWRRALTRQVAPVAGDVIADIGSGTGTQLKNFGRACAGLTLIGIDPDPLAIERARGKVAKAGVTVEFMHGYARDAGRLLAGRKVNKVISSLVFHQVPLAEKRDGLASMYAALVPGGSLHVADYGLQRTPKMRKRFRIVQAGDGIENTEPNAQGVLPELMAEVGFADVWETQVIDTTTGSISLYRATRRA